jgi:hypothetical protein
MALKDLCEIVDKVRNLMTEQGFNMPLVLTNDYFTITGKELIMKIPLSLTVSIPKESLGSDDAIRQAISQAISPTHPQESLETK